MRLPLGLLVGLVLSFGATAQETYPSRPIRIIVPYPPGDVTDLVGRIIADGLREKLNTSAFVENKPGANGIPNFGIAMFCGLGMPPVDGGYEAQRRVLGLQPMKSAFPPEVPQYPGLRRASPHDIGEVLDIHRQVAEL